MPDPSSESVMSRGSRQQRFIYMVVVAHLSIRATRSERWSCDITLTVPQQTDIGLELLAFLESVVQAPSERKRKSNERSCPKADTITADNKFKYKNWLLRSQNGWLDLPISCQSRDPYPYDFQSYLLSVSKQGKRWSAPSQTIFRLGGRSC